MLKGFIIGLALTIIAGQLPKLFGIEKGDGDFFEKIWDLIRHLGDTQWRTLVGRRRRRSRSCSDSGGSCPMIPGSLVAVAFGVVAVYAFDLDEHGVEIVGRHRRRPAVARAARTSAPRSTSSSPAAPSASC